MKFSPYKTLLITSLFALLAASGVTQAADFFDDFTSPLYDGSHKIHAVDTDHFTIEFSPLILSGPDKDGTGVPDRVEQVAQYAETSWDEQIGDLGMPSPLDDQDTVYVILDDRNMYLTPGSLGVTSVFPNGDIYMAVDPTLSQDLMKVTVAHEFMHVIQFGYQGYFVGYDQDINFAESIAVWAEEYVYDEVNDYLGYLQYYFDDPDYSVFTGIIPEGSLFEYGLAIWPIFVTEYFGDDGLIEDITDEYFSSEPDVWDFYDAYEAVIDDEGEDLRDVYQEFALWNYVWSYYDEGEDYPWVAIHAQHAAYEYPLSHESVDQADWPALFGTNYVQFEISSDMWGDDFKVTLAKLADIDLGVTLMPESDDTYYVSEAVTTIIEAGHEEATITIPIYEDDTVMTLILTPLSSDPRGIEDEEEAFEVSYECLYSVEVGDFLAEGDDAAIEMSEEAVVDAEVDGGKEGDMAGENITGEVGDAPEFDDLTVSEVDLTSSTVDSVTLSWTRVLGEDVAGYTVYYGTESGWYDFYEYVEGAHITHATISDLWTDTFYFVVVAYDEDGDESETYSNEVTVTLETITFTDVFPSHRNYEAIRFLTYLGVLEGYDDGSFLPNESINRAELMKVMVYGWLGQAPDAETYRDCFPDVTDEWYAPYVCYAYEEGWVQGYVDGYFHPENTVSKVEALKMIIESYGVDVPENASVADLPYDGVYSSAWYAPYLVTAYDMGLLEEESGDFDVDAGRTRAEVTEEIFRLVVLDMMGEEAYNDEVLDGFLNYWAEYFL